jgi:hypothetical protein
MPCYHPINIKVKGEYMTLPCSRCIGCRLERSRQWAIRCVHESQMHKENSFITLTYRDSELTHGGTRPTLYPRHLTLFLKRLRKKCGSGIRFFACGEYGSSTLRPHYHACIFGLDWKDKKLHTIKNGNRLYRSNMLDDIWSHGNCLTGDVTFESAAYVARYICDKKLGKEAVIYEKEGVEPEFVRMSRRPGIGRSWLERYSASVFNNGYLWSNGHKVNPPSYYKRIFKANEPEEMEKRALELKDILYDNPDINNLKRLAVMEEVKKARIISLKKNDL